MKIKIAKFKEWKSIFFAYCIFMLFNLLYFYHFSISFMNNKGTPDIDNALSITDHNTYAAIAQYYSQGGYEQLFSYINNDKIGYIYYLLNSHLKIDLIILSFIINNIIFSISFLVFRKILRTLNFSSKYSYLFFLNPSLIEYSQLINKESFSFFIVLLTIYLIIKKKRIELMILIPLSMLVRIQLGIFACFLYILFNTKKQYYLMIIMTYMFTSLFTIAFPNLYTFDSNSSLLGFDLSNRFNEWNKHYYIVYLLFNPIRIIQYIFDFCRPLFSPYNFNTNLINWRNIAESPSIIAVICVSKYIFIGFAHLKNYMKTNNRILALSILAYLFNVLMFPLIQARYLFPMIIPLILFGIYVRKVFLSDKANTNIVKLR